MIIKSTLVAFAMLLLHPAFGESYDEFLKKIIAGTVEDKKRKKPHSRNPKEIGKVFAARYLSKNGPASYGFAVLGLDEVMFVDVGAFLHDDSRFLNRTMVDSFT